MKYQKLRYYGDFKLYHTYPYVSESNLNGHLNALNAAQRNLLQEVIKNVFLQLRSALLHLIDAKNIIHTFYKAKISDQRIFFESYCIIKSSVIHSFVLNQCIKSI
ncbi:unnamed protein product [Rhizophagus irregularis]|nr:unnamed protein product [Rhizophagus irregularis]